MSEHPIIMTVDEVRGIIRGTKRQTRRPIATREPLDFIGGSDQKADPSSWGYFFDGPDHNGYMVLGRGHNERFNHGSVSIPSPYGERGDTLWVRESWAHDAPSTREACASWEADGEYHLYHRATDAAPATLKWKSPMIMPRWACRLTLRVEELRVLRLQDITTADARAEGVAWDAGQDERAAFRARYEESAWNDNPWVWAITFDILEYIDEDE